MSARSSKHGTIIGASLAAIGASACCVLPLVLLSLGIGGSWISTLTAMEPYRPYFSVLTLALLSIAFYQLYIKPKNCSEGDWCANPQSLKRQRIIFWWVAAILILLLAFPYYAEFIFI